MSECSIDHRGSTRWYQNNVLHRDDGPAIEWWDGHKQWCQNGVLHRDDGPAIVCPDGYKEWWLQGRPYTEEEFILLQFSKGIITNE